MNVLFTFNLNTSHVKVNRLQLINQIHGVLYLNTSHVKVNHLAHAMI